MGTALHWAIVFFVISLIAGALGFSGLSQSTAGIAKVLFYIAVIIFVILLILGLTVFKAVT